MSTTQKETQGRARAVYKTAYKSIFRRKHNHMKIHIKFFFLNLEDRSRVTTFAFM